MLLINIYCTALSGEISDDLPSRTAPPKACFLTRVKGDSSPSKRPAPEEMIGNDVRCICWRRSPKHRQAQLKLPSIHLTLPQQFRECTGNSASMNERGCAPLNHPQAAHDRQAFLIEGFCLFGQFSQVVFGRLEGCAVFD